MATALRFSDSRCRTQNSASNIGKRISHPFEAESFNREQQLSRARLTGSVFSVALIWSDETGLYFWFHVTGRLLARDWDFTLPWFSILWQEGPRDNFFGEIIGNGK